jgi:hypothetical protein
LIRCRVLVERLNPRINGSCTRHGLLPRFFPVCHRSPARLSWRGLTAVDCRRRAASHTASASRRRRCIDICPPRGARIPQAFENGRFIPKTGRSGKVSAWRRAAAVRRFRPFPGNQSDEPVRPLTGHSARRRTPAGIVSCEITRSVALI